MNKSHTHYRLCYPGRVLQNFVIFTILTNETIPGWLTQPQGGVTLGPGQGEVGANFQPVSGERVRVRVRDGRELAVGILAE